MSESVGVLGLMQNIKCVFMQLRDKEIVIASTQIKRLLNDTNNLWYKMTISLTHLLN